ncbi:hypothetical protein [Nocardia sp. NPDC019395]|uniref:hypothetical protein n=1 Tax=Nocardia sp. NPDC019395 TaxID=3154686 RepID=UPI0033CF645F
MFDLLGMQLSPRIRDLGRITLYRPGPRAAHDGERGNWAELALPPTSRASFTASPTGRSR